MVIGFVLVSVAPTHIRKVYKELSDIPEVIELNALFGEYELIAKIEAENIENLANIVIDKIRKIKGISDTRTLRGIKLQNKQKGWLK